MNAAQCPACKAYANPANDVECWRCGLSFLGERFWEFLYE